MLPSAIYEPLPFAYMGSGLLLLGIADQPGLLLAGLAFYLAGSLAWFRRGAYRRPDKQQLRKQGWPLWLYESRPFALILLGLLMLRLATHPVFLAPAFVWCLLGGYQLLQRHYNRIVLARVLA
ncbi:hypothetical protein [Aeromonas hydrophila]|uniref:hypothetical protein n=1 Tax=Aeromonas hydrophila TaxID=644 RepID=UPI0007607DD9|nr:hypothetical protein [Aeromonas hydrophila]KWR68035.1 hypothetical protein ATO50_02300 [Aeromonas hydrophila]HAU4929125.1 hypothetical protein [Aeromonas hydrophila]